MLVEELAPLVGELGAVGLNRVLDRHAGAAMLLDARDRAAEEVEPHQRRLAALPGNRDLGSRLRLEQLPDVGVEQIVRHAEAVARIQHLLREEEAVLAIEIADRAGGLREHVKVTHRAAGRRRRGSGHTHVGSPNPHRTASDCAGSARPGRPLTPSARRKSRTAPRASASSNATPVEARWSCSDASMRTPARSTTGDDDRVEHDARDGRLLRPQLPAQLGLDVLDVEVDNAAVDAVEQQAGNALHVPPGARRRRTAVVPGNPAEHRGVRTRRPANQQQQRDDGGEQHAVQDAEHQYADHRGDGNAELDAADALEMTQLADVDQGLDRDEHDGGENRGRQVAEEAGEEHHDAGRRRSP